VASAVRGLHRRRGHLGRCARSGALAAIPAPLTSCRDSLLQFALLNEYCYGKPVINGAIFGVPIPVARSYPGVVGNKPLLFVRCPSPVMSLKYC
jgi:hypothetical protein